MHAAFAARPGAVVDVSIQEALATMAAAELARAGLGGKIWSRRRLADGNGATVTILPARDGYAAEIEYFVECCRQGQSPSLCPPAESAAAVELMLALLAARERNGEKTSC